MSIVTLSNSISSRDFLIIIRVNQLDNIIKEYIVNWFLSKLNNLTNPAIYNNYDNDYAFNVIVDDYIFSENENKFIEIGLHLEWFNGLTMDENKIIYTNPIEPLLLSPDLILSQLTEPSLYITMIGISGISINYMKKKWWQLLGGSDGYLIKNIYEKDIIDNIWKQSPDRSNTYEWCGYPLNSYDILINNQLVSSTNRLNPNYLNNTI